MKSQKASIEQNTALIYVTNDEVDSMAHLNDQICAALDDQQQRARLGNLEFEGIPDQSTRTKKEDTTELIIGFCKYYLGIDIFRSDISISHRQPIEKDRKKFGETYIPPIYVRFINRQLAFNIMQRRYLLKNERNCYNEKFFIRENLTLQRRLIRDRAKDELTSFQFQWVKNGVIFVKKNSRSRPIRVLSEAVLKKLIREQNREPIGFLTPPRVTFANAFEKQKSLSDQFVYQRHTIVPTVQNPPPASQPSGDAPGSQMLPASKYSSQPVADSHLSISVENHCLSQPIRNNPILPLLPRSSVSNDQSHQGFANSSIPSTAG